MWPGNGSSESIWGADAYQTPTRDHVVPNAETAFGFGAFAGPVAGAVPLCEGLAGAADNSSDGKEEGKRSLRLRGTTQVGGSSSSTAPAPVSSAPLAPDTDAAAAAAGVQGSRERELINNEFCEVCQGGGRLLLCERCPRAYHVRCIERFVDLDAIAQHTDWACPVCCHGVDVLRGQARVRISPREMQANMEDAQRRNRALKRASVRRRDQFLSGHLELVRPFATTPALTRCQRLLEDRQLPWLDVGTHVTAISGQGRRFDAVVLLQTAQRKYVVANLETKAELELDRESLCQQEEASHEGPLRHRGAQADFLGFAHKEVLSEGTTLKSYQATGVNWLVHMFYNRCGGILADDMGLGKTIQTLTFLSYLHTSANVSGPFLVVAPLSCAGNWIREIKRFVPHMSVAKLCGVSREREFCLEDDETWYGMKDIIVTTYETISSTADFFLRHIWSVVVLDEAHRIKNQASRAREVLDNIECASRVLLTGTPLQNNLGELFALLRFLWPDVLVKSSEVFESAVRLPGAVINGPGSGSQAVMADGFVDVPLVERIRSLLGMLMLRRQKEDVISLPSKVFYDIWLPLSPSQVKWYKALLRCRLQVQRNGLRAMLKLVVRLRQLSGHPRCIAASAADREQLEAYANINKAELRKLSEGQTFCEEYVAQSGKLAFLDKLLRQLHAQNMGFSNEWRKAFEDRQRRSGDEKKTRRSAASWLKSMDGVAFLDDMRPWRATSGTESGSAKTDQDDDDLPRPHKVLIFSQFHACLDMLEAYCSWRGWRSLRLDGSTMRVLRELDMRDFNSNEEDYFVYLVGTRAGGLGVNLASANHVVLFDQDWNPHVDHQAIDRAHRIGQTRRVHVHKLIQEWGVEERLVHRQAQKLKMEQCVIQAEEGEGDEAFASERLSGDEVHMLLTYGEDALEHFAGESLQDMSLSELLERKHQPLPKTEARGDRAQFQPQAADGSFVEDDGEGGSHLTTDKCKARLEEAEAAAQSQVQPPPRPVATSSQQGEVVRRTASGRAVRAPTRIYVPTEVVKKPTAKKEPMRHDRCCFACGRGPQARQQPKRRGRPQVLGLPEQPEERESEEESEAKAADVLCSKCPKAYHSACLGPHSRALQTGRWVCAWHYCEQCERSASACGGMLIHCSQCPTALCYDCFPPNFRRVYPPEKFWTDLNGRGWKVTPQQMVFFRCNSCRALEEQCRRKQMRAEDLEAQDDERKRAALEEKRNLAATKRQAEAEDARRRLRQVMLDHERSQLSQELQRWREKLLRAAASLWPQAFRVLWLERCAPEASGEQLATEAILTKRKKLGKARLLEWVQRARASITVCGNCSFPGHRLEQCPLPQERAPQGEADNQDKCRDKDQGKESEGEGEEGEAKRGSQRRLCGLCKQAAHDRVQCPELQPEDREEYCVRFKTLASLAEALQAAPAVAEPRLPALSPEAIQPAQLVQLWRQTGTEVAQRVEAIMQENNLGSYILPLPEGSTRIRPFCTEVHTPSTDDVGPGRSLGLARAAAPKAKATAMGKAKAKTKVKGKAKAKAQAKEETNAAKAKGAKRGPGPVELLGEDEDEMGNSSDEPSERVLPAEAGRRADVARGTNPGQGTGRGIVVLRRNREDSLASAPQVARPKAKSTAAQQMDSQKRQAAQAFQGSAAPPSAKTKAKAKAKAKDKTKPKAASEAKQQQEERILIDGVAAGWTVHVSASSDGLPTLRCRGPGSSTWMQPSGAAPGVRAAIEAEGQDILHGLCTLLGCPGQTFTQVSALPGGQGLELPEPSPPPPPQPKALPEPAVRLVDAREIIRGPAVGWVIRGRVGVRQEISFLYRRPGGSHWEAGPEAAKAMTPAAWEVVEREKASIQDRLQAKLIPAPAAGPSPGRPGERQGEVMQVAGGPAAGWSVRATTSATDTVCWSFRAPKGTQWQSLDELRQAAIDPTVCAALEVERGILGSRLAASTGKCEEPTPSRKRFRVDVLASGSLESKGPSTPKIGINERPAEGGCDRTSESIVEPEMEP